MILVAGLTIGVLLGALGGGGSILAVPALVYLSGRSVAEATSISLVAVGVAALVSVRAHARRGTVRFGPALAFVTVGIAGSMIGNRIHERLDDQVLMLLFSGLILLAAHRMLTACPSCTNIGAASGTVTVHRKQPAVQIAWIVAAGSVVGVLTGLLGVGGGFVVVPALTLALGFNMAEAIGTSLLVVSGNSAVSLAIRGLDTVDWNAALPFVAVVLAGSIVGAMIAPRLPPLASLRVFAATLVLVAVGNGIASTMAIVSS